jgi:ubiquinone/menaquinone biosynthesis methyltransferase
MRLERATEEDDGLYDEAAVRGLFDRMSRSYERMNIVMSFGFSVRWRRQMMRLLPSRPTGARVLDAMSGMGETWTEVLRAIPEARAAALDFSPRMIEHAGTRNRTRFQERFELLCEDVLDNDLPDAAFDVVVSAYGLKTFDEAQSRRFANELARILRPGGTFSFVEVTEPPNRVLRALYDLYLSRIVPVVGVALVSDPVEYRMLHRYLRRYGDGARSTAAFADHPSLQVQRRLLFFGCATSWSGTRIGTGAAAA